MTMKWALHVNWTNIHYRHAIQMIIENEHSARHTRVSIFSLETRNVYFILYSPRPDLWKHDMAATDCLSTEEAPHLTTTPYIGCCACGRSVYDSGWRKRRGPTACSSLIGRAASGQNFFPTHSPTHTHTHTSFHCSWRVEQNCC